MYEIPKKSTLQASINTDYAVYLTKFWLGDFSKDDKFHLVNHRRKISNTYQHGSALFFQKQHCVNTGESDYMSLEQQTAEL
jgi:hypothetical protein